MDKPNILVVDDDASIRKYISANLKARNYEVLQASDGTEAFSAFGSQMIDLILLDIAMPGIDGFEVCRRVREYSKVPIVVLSARNEDEDKVRCLELGADDYLTKPFSLNELLCRIKVVLRRTKGTPDKKTFSYYCDDLEIDYQRKMVFLRKNEVKLTGTEFKILTFLAQNAGRVIAPRFILEKVWGPKHTNRPDILWVNLSRLRKKLGDSSRRQPYIETRPGTGYVLREGIAASPGLP